MRNESNRRVPHEYYSPFFIYIFLLFFYFFIILLIMHYLRPESGCNGWNVFNFSVIWYRLIELCALGKFVHSIVIWPKLESYFQKRMIDYETTITDFASKTHPPILYTIQLFLLQRGVRSVPDFTSFFHDQKCEMYNQGGIRRASWCYLSTQMNYWPRPLVIFHGNDLSVGFVLGS